MLTTYYTNVLFWIFAIVCSQGSGVERKVVNALLDILPPALLVDLRP